MKKIVFDMFPLGQGIKTGVYRVSHELLRCLAADERFAVRFAIPPALRTETKAYIDANAVPGLEFDAQEGGDVLFLPFGCASTEVFAACPVTAHFIHDLIAVRRPEWFSDSLASQVQKIVASLTSETCIFVNSEHTKKDLLDVRPDLRAEQITVIPLAAGEHFYHCDSIEKASAVRKKYGIPQGVPFVLSLSTLEVRKNLDTVIAAFCRMLDVHPTCDACLVLAGMTGWKLEKLQKTIASLTRWRERVIITGFVEEADLAPLYSDATCFAYLSYYEGFGLPPLEAMQCGTPVIVSDAAALPEVVGNAGMMYAVDAVDEIARAMFALLSQPDLRAHYARAAVARSAHFNWNRSATLIATRLLKDLAAQKGTLSTRPKVRDNFLQCCWQGQRLPRARWRQLLCLQMVNVGLAVGAVSAAYPWSLLFSALFGVGQVLFLALWRRKCATGY